VPGATCVHAVIEIAAPPGPIAELVEPNQDTEEPR
jgi:hypothetical protein